MRHEETCNKFVPFLPTKLDNDDGLAQASRCLWVSETPISPYPALQKSAPSATIRIGGHAIWGAAVQQAHASASILLAFFHGQLGTYPCFVKGGIVDIVWRLCKLVQVDHVALVWQVGRLHLFGQKERSMNIIWFKLRQNLQSRQNLPPSRYQWLECVCHKNGACVFQNNVDTDISSVELHNIKL